jgi:hypothetical protein
VTRQWTPEVDAEADRFFRTLTIPELRRRQSLADQQMEMAHAQRKTDALLDLRAMHDALTREVARRTDKRARRATKLH